MMVKVLLLAALATVLVSAEVDMKNFVLYGPFEVIDMPKLWNMYKTVYNKSYSEVEDQKRLQLFEKAVKSVVKFNLKSIANTDFELDGINSLSDSTPEEYQNFFEYKTPVTAEEVDTVNSPVFSLF
ncbi:uncharacterized protein LOC109538325 [Dendroctonus ponderosae]|uniref:uncharacterized protein LOC109538325 n=1 Tax=Dendroctonus ponderosae TaxID=77166 RepID=UPI002035D7DF|nr:uncharacterized protein LOC109538325 [Dendroctonus ponderosae]KAH1025205.1 hypothetical protein HUJ05_009977 [Dendroctonus ponderosae]